MQDVKAGVRVLVMYEMRRVMESYFDSVTMVILLFLSVCVSWEEGEGTRLHQIEVHEEQGRPR